MRCIGLNLNTITAGNETELNWDVENRGFHHSRARLDHLMHFPSSTQHPPTASSRGKPTTPSSQLPLNQSKVYLFSCSLP